MKENLLNNVRKRVMVWMALASNGHFPSAQTYRLSGCVQDENRQPVEVANVLLKQAKDSTYITGMLTDTQGVFPLTSHWENTCCILPLSAAKTSTFPLCCKETKTLAN